VLSNWKIIAVERPAIDAVDKFDKAIRTRPHRKPKTLTNSRPTYRRIRRGDNIAREL
jgi:hypothetical protein